MTTPTPETTYTLEDGTTAKVGDRVFNYYDRQPVTITGDDFGGDGWFLVTNDEPVAEGSEFHRSYSLNGERCCSLDNPAAKATR